jgi:hypothetical protein
MPFSISVLPVFLKSLNKLTCSNPILYHHLSLQLAIRQTCFLSSSLALFFVIKEINKGRIPLITGKTLFQVPSLHPPIAIHRAWITSREVIVNVPTCAIGTRPLSTKTFVAETEALITTTTLNSTVPKVEAATLTVEATVHVPAGITMTAGRRVETEAMTADEARSLWDSMFKLS